ncbi:HK97 family phage prohead protease [Rhizobium lusitanum]|nr:HK97 family phage prohead protease [Rhizobium lusitanum]
MPCASRSSVGFERPVSSWRDTVNGRLRIITDCDLIEISVCRDPAYRSGELFAGKMRIEAFEARIATAA